MSKVTHIDRGVYYALDCAHILNGFDVEGVLKRGDEVDCPACADNEERVTEARVEALEAVSGIEPKFFAHQFLNGYGEAKANALNAIDKLIEDAK